MEIRGKIGRVVSVLITEDVICNYFFLTIFSHEKARNLILPFNNSQHRTRRADMKATPMEIDYGYEIQGDSKSVPHFVSI